MTRPATALEPPVFTVISGAQVQRALEGREETVVDLVQATYLAHGAGLTINPPSYFLRFPDRPTARIIALPASVAEPVAVDGLKWISSFPLNVEGGLPRASAVLILNDPRTGYPFACLESSIISAVRTAASAALAADWFTRNRKRPRRIGFVGTGLIARYIHRFLAATGWQFDQVGLHDLSRDHAAGLRDYLQRSGEPGAVVVHERAEDLLHDSDLVVFATVASTPHVHDAGWLSHDPIVLHVSLRDLAPQLLLSATNIVDDVEHCLKAGTSPHLAEQLVGHREFLHGTLADVLTGAVRLPADGPLIFSPFGLGVLDLAVGAFVHREVTAGGSGHIIPGFFHEVNRYG